MLLKFYPDPNVGDPTAYTDNGVANYVINKDTSGHSNQFDIRGDQYFGSNQKFLVWGRYTWKNFPTNSPEPLLVPSAQNTNQSRVLKLSANWTITPQHHQRIWIWLYALHDWDIEQLRWKGIHRRTWVDRPAEPLLQRPSEVLSTMSAPECR